MAIVSGGSGGSSVSSAMVLLGSSVLAAPAATFDTNTVITGGTIPGTYNHLKIVLLARDTSAGTGAAVAAMTFNNDGTANYDWQYSYGNQAAQTAAQSLAASSGLGGLTINGGATASLFGQSELLIANYAGTTAKKVFTVQCFSQTDVTVAGPRIWMIGGSWRNTAAITRIIYTPASGNFAIGSAFYIYGVA